MRRRLRGAIVALTLAGGATSAANALTPSTPAPGDLGSPENLRDYGTPTSAPGKNCPFVGQIPVQVPVVQPVSRTSAPALAQLDLSQPSVPSSIYGELCMTGKTLEAARAGHTPTVLLLIHGITYGTPYWDFPYQPQKYSAVNNLIQDGYATLNIDRLGSGRSAHPLSTLTTLPNHAETVHQLVGALRAGDVGGIPFRNVATIGHSYGSAIAWYESALHNDVDATISTGYTNRTNALNASNLVATTLPAAAVPTTAGEPWAIDPGYLQPRPGTRAIPELYHLEAADPGAIAKDDELASTATVEEFASFPPPQYVGTIKNKTVPSFVVNGEYDTLTCGADARFCATRATADDGPSALEAKATAFRDWEAPAHNSASCLRAAVVPDAGHDVNLHPNAAQLYDTLTYFLDQAVGTDGAQLGPYRAACDTATTGSPPDRFPELGRLVPPVPTDGVG